VKFSTVLKPVFKTAAVCGVASLVLTACAANEAQSSAQEQDSDEVSGELTGAGASSQGSAQEAWIAGFQTKHSGVTVNYDPSGSGNGRETFQSGASAFAGSDRAFEAEEISKGPFQSCKADSGIVEFPAYISPIAVVFNLDGVKSLNLDADTIAKIFAGKITTWDDSAIASQNPDVSLPHSSISAVHRSDKSGTTENFTDYLSSAAPDSWTAGAIEQWPKKLGGEAAQQTSGMVSAVENGKGTIGYVDASRAEGLGTVNVKVGSKYVKYTPEAAAKVVDASSPEDGRGKHDLAISLDRTSDEAGVYPIVLVSYLIGCEAYEDKANAELVKKYFEFVVSDDGQKQAADAAGAAPLSKDLQSKITPIIDSVK
jgi:phosphate transport system substrate-binding protein